MKQIPEEVIPTENETAFRILNLIGNYASNALACTIEIKQ